MKKKEIIFLKNKHSHRNIKNHYTDKVKKEDQQNSKNKTNKKHFRRTRQKHIEKKDKQTTRDSSKTLFGPQQTKSTSLKVCVIDLA